LANTEETQPNTTKASNLKHKYAIRGSYVAEINATYFSQTTESWQLNSITVRLSLCLFEY